MPSPAERQIFGFRAYAHGMRNVGGLASVPIRAEHGYEVWKVMSEDRVLRLSTGELISIIRTGTRD